MDARFAVLRHGGAAFIAAQHHGGRTTRSRPSAVAVLSRESPSGHVMPPSNSCSKTVYNDNWFDRLAINHLSQSLQSASGMKSSKGGFDGLVEAAGAVYRKFKPEEQQRVVLLSLEKAFPRPILSLILGRQMDIQLIGGFSSFVSLFVCTMLSFYIKMLLPQSKFTREYFAVFTTVFFAWLIGPCEVRESELDGRIEKNVVHIKKCRLLEGANCVGVCTNLCKMASQSFIKESLGMPLYMVPNFDDMSCEMIYGQEPPLPKDDPAYAQPCYKLCKDKRKHNSCLTQ